MDGIPLRHSYIFLRWYVTSSIRWKKQSCRMPTILEGNIAIDSQGMRNYLGFFSNFRLGNFRIPDLFKFGRSNKLGSK